MNVLHSLKVAWKLGARQIWQHPGRSALTLTSITISVAAVVAITIASRATDQAMEAMFDSLTGRASLEITSESGVSMNADIAQTISDLSEIQATSPIVQRPSVLFFDQHRVKLLTLGVDPTSYLAVHPFTIKQGESLEHAKGALLETNLADSIGAKPGDVVRILTRRGLLGLKIAGLFQSDETMVTTGGAGLLMPLAAAQYASKMPNKVHSIELLLDPASDEDLVRTKIAGRLPPGIRVAAPGAKTSFAEETSLSVRQGMLTARSFLLLVAILIVTNTYLINVSERRSQFGIMRAIGATRGQVASILCCEAFLLGSLGAVLGWFIGILGAAKINDAMSRLYETNLPAIELSSLSFALAIMFGIGMSLLGVWLPARRAGRLSPVEAMRSTLASETEGTSLKISLIGLALVVSGSAALAAGIARWMPTDATAWSGVTILAGLVLLIPMIVSPLSAWMARLMKPFAPCQSRLARLQLLRHRTRTALTIGVLFIAISTGVGLASSVIDNVSDVKNWYQRTMVADYFLRAMSPDMSTGQAADMPDEVGEAISKIDHIHSIESTRFVRARTDNHSVIVVTFDSVGALSRLLDSMVQGESPESRTFQSSSDVIVGSVLANRLKRKAGDAISLTTDEGMVSLRIAAVVNDYLAGGQTIYMDRREAESLLGVGGVDAYLIHAEPKHLLQVRDELQSIARKYGLLLESFSDVHDEIDRRMAGVVAGLWAMVAIGFVVATLGVANTLTMNVLEQTRELGLLRIVGATQRQIRQIIFSQAIMIGILALVPGGIAGMVIAYLISLTTYAFSGHAVVFDMHPALVLGGMGFGLLVVVAAAWLPARRAAKLPLLKTLAQR
jgi:putative ABC transport system permease protein